MGGNVNQIADLGDAGPDQLKPHPETLKSATAIVVVAGGEGALPSVIASHVGCPVFVVPTSGGDGAKPDAIAAFLATLKTSAANVAVVDIDAGFKAGYLAAMVSAKR